MKNILLCLLCIISFTQSSAQGQALSKSDSLLLKRYKAGYNSAYLYSQEYQLYLDSMLSLLPTQAWYWQQKAMPMFKQKKYEAGMVYLDSAVKYDQQRWLDYRAFIKCIFQKSYAASIADFEKAKLLIGFSFVMDHSYDFYMGLCYLQLNKFIDADSMISRSIRWNEQHNHEGHYLEYFYLGIVKMEMKNFDEAIRLFDKSLSLYPHFPDPQYYKALCHYRKNDIDAAKQIMSNGLADLNAGYTNNEDNNFYEEYPYQQRKLNFELMLKNYRSMSKN